MHSIYGGLRTFQVRYIRPRCGLPNRTVIEVTDTLAIRAKTLVWPLYFPTGLRAATIRGDA